MEVRPEVTVILPCRNEETTVGACIDEARKVLKRMRRNGEILVVDNASEDASARIAMQHGARLVREPAPGYGNALRTGIAAARGGILLIADSDTTYDMTDMLKLYKRLKSGKYDLVIGNRFAGGIEAGAMPVSHIIGGKVLSALARKRFSSKVRDFHCGLRGLTRRAAERLELKTEGMEFATEMIAQAQARGMRIGQVPVSLKKSRFPRSSKLRTIRDGFRHLGYIIKGER